MRGFRGCQTGLGQCDLGAARLNHQDVVLDELFDELDMHPVLLHPGVGAANDPGHAANAAVDDVVIERGVGTAEGPAQHVVDVFVRESVYAGALVLGNLDFGRAVLEAVDRLEDHGIGAFARIVLVELHMLGAFDVAAWVGGDQRRLVAVRYRHQALLDALDVDTHGIHGAGHQNRFGGHEVARMRNAVTREHFRPRATHAQQVDALGTGRLGLAHQHRVRDRYQHGFEQVGLVPVNDDVDLVFLQTAHVHIHRHRGRRPEENIGNLGGHHGAAPAVGQSGAAALLGDILVVLVHAHVGAVHEFHDLPHGPPGHDTLFAPGFKGLGRNPLGKRNLPLDLDVGPFELFVKIGCDLLDAATLGFDADFLGHAFQFVHVLDFVIQDFAVDHLTEEIQHAHTMVGMGGAAGGHHAGKIAGHDGIDSGAANPHLVVGRFGVQPTGSHGAMLAAGGIRPDGAGFHVGCAVKGGFNAVAFGLLEHLSGGFANGHVFGDNLLLGDGCLLFHFSSFPKKGWQLPV